MSSLHVSYEQLSQAAAHLTAQKDAIHTDLERIRSYLTELVQGGFVTQYASGRFQGASDEFIRGAAQTIGGLEQLATYLLQAAQALEETDRTLAARLQ
ncbi:MAG: WXG100 family type VII secretion target [Microbacteriaceae bacterium]|jgi:uncharacterized protein YukE|nr:WXG100 family type VII secretion target [Microbacteriaceae bacterium]